MKRILLFSIALLIQLALTAQKVVAGFEDLGLPPNTFSRDAGTAGYFSSGNVALPNTYDPIFASWSGWAISNTTDATTPGYTNESSAIAGGGAEGSAAYAVHYQFGPSTLALVQPGIVQGMYITNSTYAYYSMRDGDAFAKRFGGATGSDPDFFLLTIRTIRNGQVGADSVNFYLADYRFANHAQDYIVGNWVWVDLSALGEADQLLLTLSSSDVGVFGINTPTYFCADKITTVGPLSAPTLPKTTMAVEVFPNPTTDYVTLRLPAADVAAAVRLFDAQGVLVAERTLAAGWDRLDVGALPAGLYSAIVRQGGVAYSARFVKR